MGRRWGARIPDERTSTTTMIQQSDNALYDAKRQGRDRVCLYPLPE